MQRKDDSRSRRAVERQEATTDCTEGTDNTEKCRTGLQPSIMGNSVFYPWNLCDPWLASRSLLKRRPSWTPMLKKPRKCVLPTTRIEGGSLNAAGPLARMMA